MYSKVEYLQVEAGLKAIEIKITAQPDDAEKAKRPAFINIYIYDSEEKLRIQALYRGEELVCHVGETSASEGCFKGAITEGNWRVITLSENSDYTLNYELVSMKEEVHDIKESSEQKNEQEQGEESDGIRWYGGDFHTHTRLSDGSLRLDEVLEVMQKNGLDFVFLTDHNMMPSHLEGYKGIFKGLELTFASGHMNIHGISGGVLEKSSRVSHFIEKVERGEAKIEDLMNHIKGLNRSINHPFMKPWHYSHAELPLSRINTLEIMCDPTWKTAPETNEKALRFLHFLNKKGHRIVGIGGSDSHLPYGEAYKWASTPSWYGDPTTYVLADVCDEACIIEAVQKGRVYISRGPKFEVLINKGTYLPGDYLLEDNLTYQIKAVEAVKLLYVDLVINSKLEDRKIRKEIAPYETIAFKVDLKSGDRCVSIEVRDEKEQLVAFINPVYRRKKVSVFTTWGEAVAAFEVEEGVQHD